MQSPENTLNQAAEWLRNEALRYLIIAQAHTASADLMATGTDKIAVNPRRRDQFKDMAVEAARLAQQFLGYATAIDMLRPCQGAPEPGMAMRLPVTFMRWCAAEDFPGEAWFKLPGGEVVRAPLASIRPAELAGPAAPHTAIDTAIEALIDTGRAA